MGGRAGGQRPCGGGGLLADDARALVPQRPPGADAHRHPPRCLRRALRARICTLVCRGYMRIPLSACGRRIILPFAAVRGPSSQRNGVASARSTPARPVEAADGAVPRVCRAEHVDRAPGSGRRPRHLHRRRDAAAQRLRVGHVPRVAARLPNGGCLPAPPSSLLRRPLAGPRPCRPPCRRDARRRQPRRLQVPPVSSCASSRAK